MNCGERWHCFFKEKSGQKRKKKRKKEKKKRDKGWLEDNIANLLFTWHDYINKKNIISKFRKVIFYFENVSSVSPTDKVSYSCIRDLMFNFHLHQKLIGVLI